MQQSQENDRVTVPVAFGLLLHVACARELLVSPMLRSGFGKHAFRHVLLSWVMFTVFVGQDLRVCQVWGLLWLVCAVYHRVKTFRDAWRGVVVHTAYSGTSHFLGRIGGSAGAATLLEMLACLGGGVLLGQWYRASGIFLACGFLSIGFRRLVEEMVMRRRMEAMMDAQIEQQYVMERYRERVR